MLMNFEEEYRPTERSSSSDSSDSSSQVTVVRRSKRLEKLRLRQRSTTPLIDDVATAAAAAASSSSSLSSSSSKSKKSRIEHNIEPDMNFLNQRQSREHSMVAFPTSQDNFPEMSQETQIGSDSQRCQSLLSLTSTHDPTLKDGRMKPMFYKRCQFVSSLLHSFINHSGICDPSSSLFSHSNDSSSSLSSLMLSEYRTHRWTKEELINLIIECGRMFVQCTKSPESTSLSVSRDTTRVNLKNEDNRNIVTIFEGNPHCSSLMSMVKNTSFIHDMMTCSQSVSNADDSVANGTGDYGDGFNFGRSSTMLNQRLNPRMQLLSQLFGSEDYSRSKEVFDLHWFLHGECSSEMTSSKQYHSDEEHSSEMMIDDHKRKRRERIQESNPYKDARKDAAAVYAARQKSKEWMCVVNDRKRKSHRKNENNNSSNQRRTAGLRSIYGADLHDLVSIHCKTVYFEIPSVKEGTLLSQPEMEVCGAASLPLEKCPACGAELEWIYHSTQNSVSLKPVDRSELERQLNERRKASQLMSHRSKKNGDGKKKNEDMVSVGFGKMKTEELECSTGVLICSCFPQCQFPLIDPCQWLAYFGDRSKHWKLVTSRECHRHLRRILDRGAGDQTSKDSKKSEDNGNDERSRGKRKYSEMNAVELLQRYESQFHRSEMQAARNRLKSRISRKTGKPARLIKLGAQQVLDEVIRYERKHHNYAGLHFGKHLKDAANGIGRGRGMTTTTIDNNRQSKHSQLLSEQKVIRSLHQPFGNLDEMAEQYPLIARSLRERGGGTPIKKQRKTMMIGTGMEHMNQGHYYEMDSLISTAVPSARVRSGLMSSPSRSFSSSSLSTGSHLNYETPSVVTPPSISHSGSIKDSVHFQSVGLSNEYGWNPHGSVASSFPLMNEDARLDAAVRPCDSVSQVGSVLLGDAEFEVLRMKLEIAKKKLQIKEELLQYEAMNANCDARLFQLRSAVSSARDGMIPRLGSATASSIALLTQDHQSVADGASVNETKNQEDATELDPIDKDTAVNVADNNDDNAVDDSIDRSNSASMSDGSGSHSEDDPISSMMRSEENPAEKTSAEPVSKPTEKKKEKMTEQKDSEDITPDLAAEALRNTVNPSRMFFPAHAGDAWRSDHHKRVEWSHSNGMDYDGQCHSYETVLERQQRKKERYNRHDLSSVPGIFSQMPLFDVNKDPYSASLNDRKQMEELMNVGGQSEKKDGRNGDIIDHNASPMKSARNTAALTLCDFTLTKPGVSLKESKHSFLISLSKKK